ncbi:MAG: histone deacetylase [Deltaproteobacteria bacterium]
MRAAVYYHADFAEKGYSTLRHRVKPGFDALHPLIKSGKIQVRTPEIDETARALLQHIHSPELIERVQAAGYHDVALLSAAGVIQAAEALASGDLDMAFCFVGSGGHHAGHNYCWGFCYYNDVVMAVNRLRQLEMPDIMIIDIDPHSGDGTRDLLAADPRIIHLNFFADEDYSYEDTARNNYGVLLDGASDQVLFTALEDYLNREWNYDLLIVIVGHDGHCLDYGDLYLTTGFYHDFARRIRLFAAGKPVMFVLSGGSLPQVASEVIPALIEGYLDVCCL